MDPGARLAANLQVLQRHDPSISHILDRSTHVVAYDFDPSNASWTKKGIEGTMFVFRRAIEPYFGVFVMNRLGLENLTMLISGDMEVQLLQEFVIYRKPDDTVHGLWMYETEDRTRIYRTLERYQGIVARGEEPPPIPPQQPSLRSTLQQPQQASSPQPDSIYGQPVDIMTLFQRASSHSLTTESPQPTKQNKKQSSRSSQQPPLPNPLSMSRTTSSNTSSSAPPITPSQRQIQRLQDIWQWVEDLAPIQIRGSLPDPDFRRRITDLLQDQVFLDALYRSYRWERPT